MGRVTVVDAWIRRTSEAIATRNAVVLQSSLVSAEAGEAATLHDDAPETIKALVHELSSVLTAATNAYAQAHPLAHSRGASRREAEEKDVEERSLCVQTAVRVAATGALVAFQRTHGKVVDHACGSSPTTAAAPRVGSVGAGSGAAALQRSCQDTLLRGMLFAFEAFAPMHAMGREHYPPRTGSRTAGTVGWDTFLLLHFVHHIPQIARHASGAVLDGAVSELVRGWRKLLVALQTVDANEAPEHSRRRGALALVNGILMMMFQRHNTHLCVVFLQTVEHAESVAQRLGDPSKSILGPSQHMVSEVVTYYYYKGRMALYERRFPEAHEALREAYHLLPPDGKGTPAQETNKRRVRFFLMVAGLLSGRATPPAILAADPTLANMFAPLVTAVERGDPIALNTALELHGTVWYRRGVYLLLQMAKLLCYLMLLARVHAAVGAMPGCDNSRISLANLIAGYHSIVHEHAGGAGGGDAVGADGAARKGKSTRSHSGTKRARALEEAKVEAEKTADEAEMEMDDDRMALWVVKLIAKGYVRGYLSHEHKTLVLSKKDPFPMLA